MLLEMDGKLVIGKSEPNPFRCPMCHRFFSPGKETASEENRRCPFCSFQSATQDFEAVKFVELAPVKLLAYY